MTEVTGLAGRILRSRLMSGVVGLVALATACATFAVAQGNALIANVGPGGVNVPAPPISDDETPLGVALRGIVVVDVTEGSVKTRPRSGVDLTRATALLQTPAFTARLAAFVGQPLSQKLISEVQAAIVEEFRAQDRPLVSVTLPPQEVTGGILRVDVLPYKVGEVKFKGNAWTPDAHLDEILRAEPGDEVNGEELVEDVNRMNVNPYRQATVTFEPGEDRGTTDLVVESKEKKPWSVSAGYEHTASGDPLTEDRLSFGFGFANLPVLDAQVQYHLELSPSAAAAGRFFELGDVYGYLSHAGSLTIPLDWSEEARHTLRISGSTVQQFDALIAPFDQSTVTAQLSVDYAIGLASWGGVRPEVYGAVELKQQQRDTLFGGVLADESTIGVVQFAAGIRGDISVGEGATPLRGRFDAKLVVSPGNLSPNNTDAAFADASANPSASASYAYLRGHYRQSAAVLDGVSLDNSLMLQLAMDALPATEKLVMGGLDTVRGYAVSEASGDWGAYVRNEVRFTGVSPAGSQVAFVPYAFLDAGYVADHATGAETTLVGIGAGADVRVAEAVDITLVAAVPLLDGPKTTAGSLHVYAKLIGTY